MLGNKEIFDINKTSVPLNKEDLKKFLDKKSFMGFVTCPYSKLVETIRKISSSSEIEVSINNEKLMDSVNNPFIGSDVFIQVEGFRDFEDYINSSINSDGDEEWKTFNSYSTNFKSEIKKLKLKVIKKFLWNVQNINSWFENKNIKLPFEKKNEITNRFESFRESVLETKDLEGFIENCDSGELKEAVRVLVFNVLKKLEIYKGELFSHIKNKTKETDVVVVSNPVINRIFITKEFEKRCREEWSHLQFTPIERNKLEVLGLWV